MTPAKLNGLGTAAIRSRVRTVLGLTDRGVSTGQLPVATFITYGVLDVVRATSMRPQAAGGCRSGPMQSIVHWRVWLLT